MAPAQPMQLPGWGETARVRSDRAAADAEGAPVLLNRVGPRYFETLACRSE